MSQPERQHLAKPPAKIFSSLQSGRGLASLLVVFHHCGVLFALPKYWGASQWARYMLGGHSGVQFFFVLSGIVILNAHLHDLGKIERIPRYLIKRARRIYPTYWVVLFSILAIFHFVPAFGAGAEATPGILVQCAMLIHLQIFQPFLIVAWTLFHEVLFYLIFALALWNKRVGLAVIALWSVAGFSVFFHATDPSYPLFSASLGNFYFSPLNMLFGFGMVVAFLIRRSTHRAMPRFHRAAPLLAGIGTLAFLATGVAEFLLNRELPALDLGYGLSTAIALCGWMSLEAQGRIRAPRWLNFLGDASYSTYLTNFAVLSLLAKLFFRLTKTHPLPLVVVFVLMSTLAVGFGILFHLAVERPLVRFRWRQSEPAPATT